ncbi:MAG: beta-ketoacyl synthase N-terminal-like domain-containing protein [Caldilineaceae bacterium]
MDGIAIIGMAGRFPGAATPQQFWQNLCNGVESIRFYAEAELLALGCSPTLLQQPNFVPAAATVDEVEWFDADFFGYAPREVSRMDPQQRLLLECAWEAIESAGYDPLATPGTTGIFASCAISTYLDYSRLFGNLAEGFYPLFIGNAQDYATSRVAYKLNLRGPSITLMTACSSSLIAVHLAVQSILNGECDMALAGGASIRLSNYPGYFYEDGGTASPDGHCRAFDAAGQGTVFGNGLGLVLLKSLEEALADGDPIYAVIRGSATNNDGSDKMGFTAPSINGQAEVIAEAMAIAEVEAEDISYIEAHGTGTSIGDPIEVAALTRVFRAQTARKGFCGIGSVKTNIGHLDVAAGIANVMKTALALHHKILPPSLHFQAPNPKLNLPDSPFYVNTTCQAWTTTALPRRAGVSSFGLGGTNAHAILEEAPTRPQPVNAVERPQHLLTLSAKSAPALQAMIARYHDFLATAAAESLADICYTSHVGRHHFAHRCTVTGASPKQMVAKLNAYLQGDTVPGLTQGTVTTTETPIQIAFLFTGQGAQFVNMGRELYETQPTFRSALDRCDQLLRPHLGASILDVLYPEGQKTVGQWTEDSGTVEREQATGASSSIVNGALRPLRERPSSIVNSASSIDQTAYTQPALFALEYALAQLWQSWGVTPDLVIGHSVGEYVAACLAGVFSLEDGLKLIAARGRLMGALPQDGAMVSLQADEARVQSALAAYHAETSHPGSACAVSIAAVNGPESTVISGQRAAVLAIAGQLAAEGVKTRQLTVSHAFHSPLMEPMLAEFRRIAAGITYHRPKLRLVSNVTGNVAGEEVTTPAYWVRHVRDAVRFADGLRTLHDQGATIYLEIGPKPTLLGMAQAILDFPLTNGRVAQSDAQSAIINPLLLPSLREGRSDWQQMLESLGALYGHGVAIHWAGFDKDYARRKAILPTYPFQRQRYWHTAQEQAAQQPVRHAGLRPLIDKMIKLPTQRLMVFETECSLARQPYLIDHVIYGRIVVAGAFHIAMVLNAVAVAFDAEACQLQDVAFLQALTLAKDETRIVQLHLQTAGDTMTFQVISYNDTLSDEPITHVTGNLVLGAEAPAPVSIPALRAACVGSVSQETIFTALTDFVAFGPSFQWSDEWRYSAEQGLARMRLPDSPNYQDGYQLFPGLIDSCIVQPMCAYYFGNFNGIQWAVPFSLDRFTFFQPKKLTTPGAIHHEELWCYGQPATPGQGADTDLWNYRLVDSEGRAVAHLDGLLRRVSPISLPFAPDPDPVVLSGAMADCVAAGAGWSTQLNAPLLATLWRSSGPQSGADRYATGPGGSGHLSQAGRDISKFEWSPLPAWGTGH